MRLLDLFCGAGGCAMGYSRAGFTEIVGVDIKPQKRYPFEFVQGDAIEYLGKHGKKFDAIHASPPCQRFSRRGAKRAEHPDFIGPTRESLALIGAPFVIENVPQSPLRNPIVIRGDLFGLGVIRERWFEANWPIVQPDLPGELPAIDGVRFFTVTGSSGGHGCKKSGNRKISGGTGDQWRVAMGIDWMTNKEIVQAIPPAYTEFIGRQLIELLRKG